MILSKSATMNSRDAPKGSGSALQAKSLEVLRKKRLAYFNSPDKLTIQTNQDSEYADKLKDANESNECSKNVSSFGSNDNLSSNIQAKPFNSLAKPKNSPGNPHLTTSTHYLDRNRQSITDSQDNEPVSVFQSYGNVSDLGLSTHRPHNVEDGSLYASEVYSGGTGRLASEIFGQKNSEQIQNALGEQGMQNLMTTVNKNINKMQRSPHVNQDYNMNNNVVYKSQNNLSNDKQRLAEQSAINRLRKTDSSVSPRRRDTTKEAQHAHSGERKLMTLSRSYDQVAVPKNTKNSFSADEIYEQAFGSHQSQLSSDFTVHNGQYPTQLQQSWNHDQKNFAPIDQRGVRRYSSNSGSNVSSPRSHHQMPSPMMHQFPHAAGYSHPMSPHSGGTSPYPPSDLNSHPGFFYPAQFRSPYPSPPNHYPVPPYPSYMPQSPSAVPRSPGGLFYPPPAYGVGQYSVPRFPTNGVPLHLPPPPIPTPPLNQNFISPRSSQEVRRNSFSYQSVEDMTSMKVPHPPSMPPALKTKDKEASGKSSYHLEHRRLSLSNGQSPTMHTKSTSYSSSNLSKEGEEPRDKFNLQRYFSSLELQNKMYEKSAQEGVSVPNSSRSAEEDFYRSMKVNESRGNHARNNQGYNNNNDDDEDYDGDDGASTSSSSSAFTSVTHNTTALSHAGGLTRRLEDLGVDLQHLRHLRVVGKEGGSRDAGEEVDQFEPSFEVLSKGVRVCPECDTKNKAYMDWCVGCGEVLIGVEPILPEARAKQGENSPDKRSSVSAGGNRNNNSGGGEKEYSRGRIASRHVTHTNSQSGRLRKSSKSGAFTPHESPESGKGLSLSSSPVRYRKEAQQEDGYNGEPKDSGRASSNDGQERSRLASSHFNRAARDGTVDDYSNDENDDDDYDDDDDEPQIIDEADFVEEEGVEYQYEDSEPNVFEQIKDPVLRDFIISYRNKQIFKDSDDTQVGSDDGGSENAGKDFISKREGRSVVLPKREDSSEYYGDSVKSSMEIISNITGTRTSQFSFDAPQYKQKSSTSDEINNTENNSLTDYDKNKGECNEVFPKYLNESMTQGKKKRKKKKKKAEPMDVEIFGYEEIRQSRNLSRANNVNAVPLLNFVRSSDEEDEDDDTDESDETDDENSERGDSSNNSDNDIHRTSKTNNNSESKNEMSLSYNGKPVGAYNANNNKQHHQPMHKSTTMPSVTKQPTLLKSGKTTPQVYPRAGNTSTGVPTKSLSQQKLNEPNSSNNNRASGYNGATNCNNGATSKEKASDVASSDGGTRARRSVGVSKYGAPAGYQRHWARSSTAWSSYHPRELSTKSSLNMSASDSNGTGLSKNKQSLQKENDRSNSRPSSGSSVSSGGGRSSIPTKQRPASAEYSRRAAPMSRQRPSSAQVRPTPGQSRTRSRMEPEQAPPPRQVNNYMTTGKRRSNTVQNSTELSNNMNCDSPTSTTISEGTAGSSQLNAGRKDGNRIDQSDEDSPRQLCQKLHRLPHDEMSEQNAEKLHAMAKNSYDKLQQMTPRLWDGEVSIWQCLPDELWLYVFEFLSHSDLSELMQTCQYFYRLANDETLWKYITVRPKLALRDDHLTSIAGHRPMSVAMVMCNGRDLTDHGLHTFFRETQDRLKELNICGCSQGALVGSNVLNIGADYCRNLTHLDASYCNLTDSSLGAISDCAERLESLCVNGFQNMSDACLLQILRKHGKGLRTLELYACFSLSASSLRSLGEYCSRLQRLCLGSCNKLTDSAMVTLSAHLPRVEELDLRGCKNLKNDSIRKIVRNCPRLSKLVLANCPHISDMALAEIATHLKMTLRHLELCGCNNVTDQGVTTLAKNCDRLISVDISSTKCTSASVYQLCANNCSRWLETVKLSFLTPLSEASVVTLIRQCPRLKVLHVFGCHSLRNLAKLRQLNPEVTVDGDESFGKFSFSVGDM